MSKQFHIMWEHRESRQRGKSEITFNRNQADWVVKALRECAPDDQLIWYDGAEPTLIADGVDWNDYNYAYKVVGIDTERDSEVFVIALGESMAEAVGIAKAYYGESFVVRSAIYLGSVVLPGVSREFQRAFGSGQTEQPQ